MNRFSSTSVCVYVSFYRTEVSLLSLPRRQLLFKTFISYGLSISWSKRKERKKSFLRIVESAILNCKSPLSARRAFNLKSIARQDTLATTLKVFLATGASTNFVKFSSLTIRRKGRKDGVVRRGSFYFNEGRINT